MFKRKDFCQAREAENNFIFFIYDMHIHIFYQKMIYYDAQPTTRCNEVSTHMHTYTHTNKVIVCIKT